MTKVLALIRSSIFMIGFVLIIIVIGTLSCVLGLVLPSRTYQSVATLANALGLFWLKLCCNIRVEIKGLEKLKAINSPFVVLSNHESTWETFFLQRLFRPVSTILKRELLYIPFFGWALFFTKPIAIDRSSPKEALKKVLKLGVERIKGGHNVLIFPAGSRSTVKSRTSYARSGAAIAIAAEATIVPLVHNGASCWPNDGFIKRSGTITVIIGEPIDSSAGNSKQLTQEVQSWIESERDKLP